MRYIDADKLEKLCDIMAEKCGGIGESIWNQFRTTVEWSPTADVVEVKHGKWKMTDAFPHWLYCDQCFKRIVPNANWIEEYNIPTNWCPNCGADMREETEDED